MSCSVQGIKRLTPRKLRWLILSLFAAPTFAVVVHPNYMLPLPLRASIWASSGSTTFGEGDAMIPIWGNPHQTFYGDISAKYGNQKAWFVSAGLGGRKIFHNHIILGAYLFTDYNKTPNGNYFTVVNPGIEFMNNRWDGHLNGYFPVGKKNDLLEAFPASQLGISNMNFFRGHAEYDSLFDLIENVGPGFDMEVGHTFNSPYLNRARVFAGGYYFNPKYTSDMNGVEVGFEIPLKYQWASVEFRDSYDNVNNNTFLVTLRFTFGGLDKTCEPDIHDRMLDRIPRHLANLNNGDGIPSKKTLVNTGRVALIRDNIWFFYADGTPSMVQGFQSCTFEHPCIGLAQTQIDTINALSPNANFYLSSGTYNNPDLGLAFSFHNGQNVFGRTSDFSQLAIGNARPLLNDSLLLEGNNNIYNVQVDGHSILNLETGGGAIPFQVGAVVRSFSTGPVNIFNSDFTSNSTTSNAAGVVNNSANTTLSIYNSAIATSILNVPGAVLIGVGNLFSGTVNLSGSTITLTQSDVVNNFDVVFGVVDNENGTINITNSNIIVNATNAGLAAAVLNNSSVGVGTINITRSNLSVVADNVPLAADIFNQANNLSGLAGTVNSDQSSLLLISNNSGGGGLGAGIVNGNDGKINLTNSNINSSGNEGIISGISNFDPLGTITIQNNIIAINLFGTAVGAPIINAGTLNDNGGNQCFQDGAPVPCS